MVRANPPPQASDLVRAAARPLARAADEDAVVAWLGDASIVLLGEATHGTHEFYAIRARLTRQLVAQRGFSAVAVEADWPDAYQVNQYVQHSAGAADAERAVAAFQRFPTWMWRNPVIAELVGWLRAHNATRPEAVGRIGFYGLDLYSLHASMRAVVAYLDRHDPAAARAARASYACFDQFGVHTDAYAWAAGRLGEESCEDAVTRQLLELLHRRGELVRRNRPAALEEFFSAEQNARLARNAERYYRTMFRGHVASWNVRDEHMAETLAELLAHLRRRGLPPKVVVWAHNSHLGDARATEMHEQGELNLGQLARERFGAQVRSLGFTTYGGTVLAASEWGEPPECQRVRPALAGSCEELFHATGLDRFFLPLDTGGAAADALREPRLERAIGVIYRPETERFSHYFHARVAEQFDGIIHVDETHALPAPDDRQQLVDDEAPETFPSGM